MNVDLKQSHDRHDQRSDYVHDEDQQEHGVSAKFVDIVPDGRLAFARQFFADTADSEIEKSGDQGN